MSRRVLATYDFDPPPPPSKCAKVMHCIWKMLTCVFSHAFLVTLVVAYCILGAFTFEHLEAENERKVKRGIVYIRSNVTEVLWKLVRDTPVLVQDNWTEVVVSRLRVFETEILTAMKQDGWDGNEDENVIQWTFAGALFYSIIVITTIGYGHIAPKTQMGKVTTIFYAILGIPLMLLCLSNIGDIMASSFRFVYWRVCCYVCTRKPKKKRRRGGTMRQSSRQLSRSRPGSLRQGAGMQSSQRSGDSGFCHGDGPISHSYSDAEFRYNDDIEGSISTSPNPRSSRYQPYENAFDRQSKNYGQRAYSLDRRSRSRRSSPRGDPTIVMGQQTRSIRGESWRHQRAMSVGADRTPVLCNKYAINDDMYGMNDVNPKRYRSNNQRYHSMPRLQRPQRGSSRCPSPMNNYLDDDESIRTRSKRREKPGPSPRIMSPMGLAVNRQQRPPEEANYSFGDDSYGGQEIPPARPVPIWLCVFLVISYIIAGAFLFSRWEKWSFLDSAYFCFITLTTIGFGDFVPAQGVKANSEISIALCSLYLLFGIALLAMSFNLVQEEVIANVKSVAKRLGIIKEDSEEIDD